MNNKYGSTCQLVLNLFSPRKTSYPATEKISLSVVAKRAVIADILSTALFSLPAEEILNYINTRDGLEAMGIAKNGEEFYSNGFVNELR